MAIAANLSKIPITEKDGYIRAQALMRPLSFA